MAILKKHDVEYSGGTLTKGNNDTFIKVKPTSLTIKFDDNSTTNISIDGGASEDSIDALLIVKDYAVKSLTFETNVTLKVDEYTTYMAIANEDILGSDFVFQTGPIIYDKNNAGPISVCYANINASYEIKQFTNTSNQQLIRPTNVQKSGSNCAATISKLCECCCKLIVAPYTDAQPKKLS